MNILKEIDKEINILIFIRYGRKSVDNFFLYFA